MGWRSSLVVGEQWEANSGEERVDTIFKRVDRYLEIPAAGWE